MLEFVLELREDRGGRGVAVLARDEDHAVRGVLHEADEDGVRGLPYGGDQHLGYCFLLHTGIL